MMWVLMKERHTYILMNVIDAWIAIVIGINDNDNVDDDDDDQRNSNQLESNQIESIPIESNPFDSILIESIRIKFDEFEGGYFGEPGGGDIEEGQYQDCWKGS